VRSASACRRRFRSLQYTVCYCIWLNDRNFHGFPAKGTEGLTQPEVVRQRCMALAKGLPSPNGYDLERAFFCTLPDDFQHFFSRPYFNTPACCDPNSDKKERSVRGCAHTQTHAPRKFAFTREQTRRVCEYQEYYERKASAVVLTAAVLCRTCILLIKELQSDRRRTTTPPSPKFEPDTQYCYDAGPTCVGNALRHMVAAHAAW